MRNTRFAVLLLLASACVTSGTYEKKEQEADQLRWALRMERQKTSELEGKIEDATAQVATAQGETDRIADRLSQVNASLAQREVALKQATAKEGQLRATVADLSKSKEDLELTRTELEARNAELVQKGAEYDQLQQSLKDEIEQGKIELAQAKGRMTVKLKDKVLFASGSAKLGTEGKQALAKIADVFKELKGKIVRVEGHTDDRPIGSAAFPSNWELSGARALAVVRYLQERGVDPAVLAGAAYSQFRPVATNDTPEGRSLNRRIEIVLAPAES
jgi:chemotaxis protein MotB